MSLPSLPNEILFMIGGNLSWRDLYALIFVSRRLAFVYLPCLLPSAVREDDQKPLLWSVKAGNEELVRELLEEHKANANPQASFSISALHLAAQYGYIAIAEMLLENGADVNQNGSPMKKVAWYTHTYEDKRSPKSVEIERQDFSWEAACIKQPLHLAAHGGHEDVIRLLLDNGADLTAQDFSGRTALCLAIDQKHMSTIKMLVMEMGAKDMNSWESGLFLAMWPRWDETIVDFLLQYADPDIERASYRANEVLYCFADDDLEDIHIRLDRKMIDLRSRQL